MDSDGLKEKDFRWFFKAKDLEAFPAYWFIGFSKVMAYGFFKGQCFSKDLLDVGEVKGRIGF